MAQDVEEAARGAVCASKRQRLPRAKVLRGVGRPEIVKEPVDDVKVLDRVVTRVARGIRLLEQALKATNAKTTIDSYQQDDVVLGELS